MQPYRPPLRDKQQLRVSLTYRTIDFIAQHSKETGLNMSEALENILMEVANNARTSSNQ